MITEMANIKVTLIAIEPICSILPNAKGSSGVTTWILTEEGRVVLGWLLDQGLIADGATYGRVRHVVHY